MTSTLSAFPGRDLVRLVATAARVQPGLLKAVVDGGAGIGDTVQPLLDASPDAHVFAYDPVAENVAVLRERFADERRVTVRPVAISDRVGKARFEVPSRLEDQSGSWAPGTSFNGYLERPGAKENLLQMARHLRKRLRRQPVDVVEVDTVRLDGDLPSTPDVVKLDLQGGEKAALTGLGSWLQDVKVVQVELQLLQGQDTHVLDMLTDAGFTPYLADLQFSAASLTDEIWTRLHAHGVRVGREVNDSAFDAHTMVLGYWAEDGPLPVRDQSLTADFAALLREARAEYFQSDFIALNDRIHWEDILSAAKAELRQ